MNTTERMAEIRRRLELALQPESLELLDESHKHIGHAGARDGRGHFCLRIVSRQFAGKSLLEQHRLVYHAMGELMLTDVHALTIVSSAP